MKSYGREAECYLVTRLSKGYRLAVRLTDHLGYLFVGFQGDFYVVKLREVGKQTYVSSVDGRRIQNVKCKEASVFILTHSYSSRRGKLACEHSSFINLINCIYYVFFKHEIARVVVCLKYGVRKIQNVSAFHERGIVCRLGFVRGVLVTAEMADRAVEIRLVNLG